MVLLFLAIIVIGIVVKSLLDDAEDKRIVKRIKSEYLEELKKFEIERKSSYEKAMREIREREEEKKRVEEEIKEMLKDVY